ncbi:hypothetical protein OG898_28735 [Streptomyces sp. NBC_00193]|uniref:hypothetical protein n=1 Tax=unclassified Streptomyces TaxID=2593676 RepID=UPI002258723E|nr:MULTISPECIES: hypothetical protein [unclassified Streptomyces]MCX5129912.1 hypothetical protein [Streptomyces sp. NBC_00347]MCX5300408.1 hypothetical protein [Streptomyces sp. NBC_00193]
MPILGPRPLFATIALAPTLTLTACNPAGEAEGPPAAPASTPVSAPARPASTRPAGSGKHTLTEAATAGGLTKATGANAVSDVPIDPGEMRDDMHLVVADYNRAGQTSGRRILFVGVDSVPEDPNKRREHLWRGLIDYALQNGSTGTPTTAKPYQPGPFGGSLECLSLPESANATDVICGWTDTATAAVALFPRTTPADAARLFASMRADLEH